jgi:phosphoglycerate dehydrogenase-like enzyme
VLEKVGQVSDLQVGLNHAQAASTSANFPPLAPHRMTRAWRARQATAARIWVSNIPSQATGNALSCAEMAVYLTLACLRSANAMAASIRERRVGLPLGRTLFGKSVLVVGFGGIAKELVPRCAHAAAEAC